MVKEKKRVLYVMSKNLLEPIEYSDFFNCANNCGNNLINAVIMSYFYNPEINTTYLTKEKVVKELSNNPAWACENFDICIQVEANIFSIENKESMNSLAKFIRNLKIPVYILGAGAQSTNDYSMEFIKEIKKDVAEYLDSILSSGGDIALRGYYTQEVLATVSDEFRDLFVSGCPTMYLNGASFQMPMNKVSKEEFRPMLNAISVSDIADKIYADYTNAVYFDQDRYMKVLYQPHKISTSRLYGERFSKLYKEKRIDGDVNYFLWKKRILNGNFNFSYGGRIHGNIIAIQNGIPAYVKAIDSRVREIVEFYNIPNTFNTPFDEEADELYDLYLRTDYTMFNRKYKEKYDNFKLFLESRQIPNVVGDNRLFGEYLETLPYFDYQTDKLSNFRRQALILRTDVRDVVRKCFKRDK